jgi:hypothetical protein
LARAFDARDDVLLAVAPFRVDGSDAAARMLARPPAIRQVEVDITDRPEMPRPSAALGAVQRAIHLGRRAARAERLGQPIPAAHRWRPCTRVWPFAGDLARAEQADVQTICSVPADGHRNEVERGGHFAAVEQPAPFVEVRAFFHLVR